MLELRDRILGLIEDERRNLAAGVAGGACGSYEDYRFQCGQIRALDRARSLVVEGFSRYVNEDEDDGDSFPV